MSDRVFPRWETPHDEDALITAERPMTRALRISSRAALLHHDIHTLKKKKNKQTSKRCRDIAQGRLSWRQGSPVLRGAVVTVLRINGPYGTRDLSDVCPASLFILCER